MAPVAAVPVAPERSLHDLPHEIHVHITGIVAATSPRPMDDLRSLRRSCNAMYVACRNREVGRRLALDREPDAMWWHHDPAAVDRLYQILARTGNPEGCFRAGVNALFAELPRRRPDVGTAYLRTAAEAGHKKAAYVLAVLLYNEGSEDEAKGYLRQVHGEVTPDKCVVINNTHMMRNTECDYYRDLVANYVWLTATWGLRRQDIPYNVRDRVCPNQDCSVRRGWDNLIAFCSEDCRIVYEHGTFYARVRPAS